MQNLSKLATVLSQCARACDELAEDPLTRYYGAGDLAGFVHRNAVKRAWKVAREHGFLTITGAVMAIEARTSDKWVYKSGLLSLCPEGEVRDIC